jgi:hypothetical protein
VDRLDRVDIPLCHKDLRHKKVVDHAGTSRTIPTDEGVEVEDPAALRQVKCKKYLTFSPF